MTFWTYGYGRANQGPHEVL